MILDVKFVLIGFLLIASLIPLYIYRREIYKKINKKGNIKAFLKDVEIYLKSNHPRINFDFSIISKYKNEKDIHVQEALIIEDFINQFVNYEYELTTQNPVAKEKLWSSYDMNSKVVSEEKRPNDWARRKETAWNRDHGKCNRCGTKTKLVDAQILLARQTKDGGGFNLENLVVLCSDCSKVIRTANKQKIGKDLNISEKLIKKVEP